MGRVLGAPGPRPTVGTGSESGKTNRRSGYRIGIRQDDTLPPITGRYCVNCRQVLRPSNPGGQTP